ncbi:MAG: hypothetical protein II620_04410, partial [Paludibacteraceae bacterium]|nr:hypothetical protein [Paludibacteraceae bacterium]
KKNVFVRSAELGVPFGIMLTVASLSMIYGDKVPLVSLLAMIVAICESIQKSGVCKSNWLSLLF